MVTFRFKDWSNKVHTKTSKANCCTYSYEEDRVLVVRDYFTNKVVSRFNIPCGWSMIQVIRK